MDLSLGTDDGPARPVENAAHALDGCRQYLLAIANDVIGPEIQGKVGASDLVQDTFLEAHRHLTAFRGRTLAELRTWLRRILECRLANIRRSYLATEKRAAGREVAIDTLLCGSDGNGEILVSRAPSPSRHAVRSELTEALNRALVRLPEHYRQAVAWRHQQQLSWDEIGQRMGCTADAARKVWGRAIQQLRQELGELGPMP
jgi:RNA polymerase sigma-70 factor (ECF subfamily)